MFALPFFGAMDVREGIGSSAAVESLPSKAAHEA
jgi:hypothetical protein